MLPTTAVRETSSALVGNTFRVTVAERLETQERANRGLMYRFFGEIADPPDGAGAIAVERSALWKRLRITPQEITRRFKLAVRICPRRSLTGPAVAPELAELAAAVAAGTVGDDHIKAICRAVDVLPACGSPADVAAAERTLVRSRRRRRCRHRGQAGPTDRRLPQPRWAVQRRGPSPSPWSAPGQARRRRDVTAERVARSGDPRLLRGHRRRSPARPSPTRPGPKPREARDDRSPGQRCHDALKLGLKTAIASGEPRRTPRPPRHRGHHHHPGRTRSGGPRRRGPIGADADAGKNRRWFPATRCGM